MTQPPSFHHRTAQEIRELFESWKMKYERALDLVTQRLKEQEKRGKQESASEEENRSLREQIRKLQEYLAKQGDDSAGRPAHWERSLAYLRERLEAEQWEALCLRQELYELQQQRDLSKDTLFPLPNRPSSTSEEVKLLQQQIEKSRENLYRAEKEWEEEKEEWQASLAILKKEVQDKEKIEVGYERLREEYMAIEKEIEEAVAGRLYAEEQWKAQQEAIKEEEKLWEERLLLLRELQEEKLLLEEVLKDHEKQLEEKEVRMKTAQQHLAKKVKENALLNDEIEKKQLLLRETENAKNQLEVKNEELQAALARQQEQQNRNQEQFHQMLKTLENQLNRKDEKYFQIFEKYKLLEEKHHQVQNLFSNLGHLMQHSVQEKKLLSEAIQNLDEIPLERKEKELFQFDRDLLPKPRDHLFES